MLNRVRTITRFNLHRKGHWKKYVFDRLEIVGKTPTHEESLKNTFKWIESSFTATGDGGSSAYYHYARGWKGSYPETTGYLIPTMYEYSSLIGSEDWRKRAKAAADWLLSIQSEQ